MQNLNCKSHEVGEESLFSYAGRLKDITPGSECHQCKKAITGMEFHYSIQSLILQEVMQSHTSYKNSFPIGFTVWFRTSATTSTEQNYFIVYCFSLCCRDISFYCHGSHYCYPASGEMSRVTAFVITLRGNNPRPTFVRDKRWILASCPCFSLLR